MELNSNQIQQIIPHRYPFLLIDKIIECIPGERVRGIKCVTANEHFFSGHFPSYHVMPGVLIIEALAQVGVVGLLTKEENKGKAVILVGIKNARFRRPVCPGDTLELSCTLTKQKGPIGVGEVMATVSGEAAVTAELSFVIDGAGKMQK